MYNFHEFSRLVRVFNQRSRLKLCMSKKILFMIMMIDVREHFFLNLFFKTLTNSTFQDLGVFEVEAGSCSDITELLLLFFYWFVCDKFLLCLYFVKLVQIETNFTSSLLHSVVELWGAYFKVICPFLIYVYFVIKRKVF